MAEVAHTVATPAASTAQPAQSVAAEAAVGVMHDALALARMLELLAWAMGPDGPFSGVLSTSPQEYIRNLDESATSLTSLSLDPTDPNAAETMLGALRTAQVATTHLQSHTRSATAERRGSSRVGLWTKAARVASRKHIDDQLDAVGLFLANLQAKYDELYTAALSQARATKGKGSQ